MLLPKNMPAALLCLSLAACNKKATPPSLPQFVPPISTSAWPAAPTGPLWEALARVPAGLKGTAGVVDFAVARADHPEWTEAGHDRNAEEFARGVLAKFEIRTEEVLTFVWAEIQMQADGGRDTFLMARLSTPVERLRTALLAAAFERASGDDEIWCPTLEKDKFIPQRVLLKDGWLVRTLGGDAAIQGLIRAWSGKAPHAQSIPHAAALVASVPTTLPAVLRFGTDEQPLPDSPLRVIAMALAADAATGEDVVTVAFNEEGGPETMMASERWKAQASALTTPPKVDRSGRFLRIRTRPDADPARLERQRSQARDTVDGLRRAISEFEVDFARFPARLEDLWTGEGRPYSGPVRNDPWGHQYLYRCPAPSGNDPYDLRSTGPDGKADTPDDIH